MINFSDCSNGKFSTTSLNIVKKRRENNLKSLHVNNWFRRIKARVFNLYYSDAKFLK